MAVTLSLIICVFSFMRNVWPCTAVILPLSSSTLSCDAVAMPLEEAERLLCAKNGNFLRMREGGGSAVSYAWFVFRKEVCDAPRIGWV